MNRNQTPTTDPTPTDPTPTPTDPLIAQLAKCDGPRHEWSDDYDDGDTCACGAFYLHARTGPGELPHIIATEQ